VIYLAIAIGSLSSFAAEGFELLAGVVGAAVVIAILIAAIVVATLAVLRIPPVRVAIRARLQRRGRVPEGLSWLAGTALHMEAFSGSPKAGDPAAVTAVLGAQLGGAGVRRPLPGVDLATTPYRTSSVLDDIAEAVKGLPRGTALAALIKVGQKLLPRYDMYLTGYLLQSPQRGSGLVLSIVSDAGTVTSSGALWADILEPRLGWPEPGYGAAPKTHADPRTAGGDGGSGPPRSGSTPERGVGNATADHGSAPSDVLRLALAGAVWVQYQLLDQLGQADFQHLHTHSWRSAALFEVAVHDESSRENRDLRALYALAVDRDPDNLPALFNLAVLELHAGLTPLACVRLRTLLDGVTQEELTAGHREATGHGDTSRNRGAGDGGGVNDREAADRGRGAAEDRITKARAGRHQPLFYQAQYTLAVALTTHALEAALGSTPGHDRAHGEQPAPDANGVAAEGPPTGAPGPAGERDVAVRLYRVTRELEEDIDDLEQLAGGESEPDLARNIRGDAAVRERFDTLSLLEGPFLVLAATTRQEQLCQARFVSARDGAVGYRLGKPFSRAEALSTLAAWERSGETEGAALEPQALAFGYVEGEPPEVSYRTHYNRACYATVVARRLGQQVEAAKTTGERECCEGERDEALTWAMAKLEAALEPGTLVDWASRDPSLQYLRDQKHDAFGDLLKLYTSRI
jgi:hypothetical protein